jgi:hypothetical protein
MTTISQTQKFVRIGYIAMATMITVTAGLFYRVPASDPVWNAPTKIIWSHAAPASKAKVIPMLAACASISCPRADGDVAKLWP